MMLKTYGGNPVIRRNSTVGAYSDGGRVDHCHLVHALGGDPGRHRGGITDDNDLHVVGKAVERVECTNGCTTHEHDDRERTTGAPRDPPGDLGNGSRAVGGGVEGGGGRGFE